MNLKTIIFAALVTLGPAVPATYAAESDRSDGMNECGKKRVYRSYPRRYVRSYPHRYYRSGYYPRSYYGYPRHYGYPYYGGGVTLRVGPVVYHRW